MRRVLKILGLAVGFVLLSALGLLVWVFFEADEPGLELAAPYSPACEGEDLACAAWAEFRKGHPFPYQGVLLADLGDGTHAIILTEPPPKLDEGQLAALSGELFADDLIEATSKTWMIGADGWVKDFLLRVQAPADLAADAMLDAYRDPIAIICERLFATSYGCDPRMIGVDVEPIEPISHADLNVTPAELHAWLSEPALRWERVSSFQAPSALTWLELMGLAEMGTFVSDDGTLVALVLPRSDLGRVASPPPALLSEIRHFAVASDLVIGGLWTDARVAIIARSRMIPMRQLPPLRAETVLLLAAESASELAQSYERNNVFAGKLFDGEYAYKDWAPILLSGSLIDTELGALLNITDQILKSWSQAGEVEYVYFDYPLKPASFPFEEPLSDVLLREYSTTETLFNWNTAGLGVAVQYPRTTILSIGRTGALPVTYGSGAGAGEEMKTGHLFEFEDRAYDFFARFGDPNLIRVVQYTALYQAFRGANGGVATLDASPIEAREASTRWLAAGVLAVLSTHGDSEPLASELSQFRGEYPEVGDEELALLLADPRRDVAELLALQAKLKNDLAPLIARAERLQQEATQFNRRVDQFMARVRAGEDSPALTQEDADLTRVRAALETEKRGLDQEFEARSQPLEARKARADAIRRLANSVRDLAQDGMPLDDLRIRFMALNAPVASPWIKTPSVVVSWAPKALDSVGGHNLDSRAIRFERSADVDGIELVQDPTKGLVARFNPELEDEVGSNAFRIARRVEHRQVMDAGELKAMLVDEPIRARRPALQVEAADAGPPRVYAGELGLRRYETKVQFIEDLRAVAEANDCCIYVARDARNRSFIVQKSEKPPPASLVVEAGDAPSVRNLLASGSRKSVVFLGHSRAQVEYISAGFGPTSAEAMPRGLPGWIGGRDESHGASIVRTGKDGRRVRLDAVGPASIRPESFVKRLSDVFRRKPRFAAVKIAELDDAATARMLEAAGWNAEVDGTPVAIAMTFESTSPTKISAIGGFDAGDVARGRDALSRASRRATERSNDETDVFEYLDRLREETKAIDEPLMKRFLMVVEEGEDTVHFSQLDSLVFSDARS